ncbi:MAG: PQQ-dependent sugar dehydrogenase [Methylotetracoccus sp.]
MTVARFGLITASGVVLAALALACESAAAAPPAGFTRFELTSQLQRPSTFAWLGNDILIGEKNTGRVRLLRPNGTIRPQAFLSLALSTDSERGLLGLATDPGYPRQAFVYVYYTTGPGSKNYAGTPKNRVSRFTVREGLGQDEQIIFDAIPSDAGNHNGGDIQFAADGTLLVSVGDGGSFPDQAQNPDSLRGKILRIQADGQIPRDNPLFKQNHGRRRAVYAFGFRNPFRFTIRPSSQATIVADVGQNDWEEIDVLQAGGNFGWNAYEGPCAQAAAVCDPSATDFGDTQAPVHYYPHAGAGETGSAIIGGVFSSATRYPTVYADAYFYGDFAAGWVHVLPMDSANRPGVAVEFDQLSCPVAFRLGPDGNVYVLDMCAHALYGYRFDG